MAQTQSTLTASVCVRLYNISKMHAFSTREKRMVVAKNQLSPRFVSYCKYHISSTKLICMENEKKNVTEKMRGHWKKQLT